METETEVAAGRTVFHTGHGHQGHHWPYGVSDKDATYASSSRTDGFIAANGAASAVETRDLAKAICDSTGVTGDRVNGAAAVLGAAVAGGNTVLGSNLCEGFKDTAKDICDLETQLLNAKAALADAIAQSQYAAGVGFAGVNLAVEKTGAANSLATEKVGAANAVALVAAANNLSVQAQTYAAATNLAIEKAAAAGVLEQVRWGGAAALAAATNTAALQASTAAAKSEILAAVAEICCCVKEDNEKTRGLISQIDRERLQARLAVFEARAVGPLAA